jgi:MGT family glycosyltransferase
LHVSFSFPNSPHSIFSYQIIRRLTFNGKKALENRITSFVVNISGNTSIMMSNTTSLKGKHILFACVPGDGHFNPLTGLAKHLQSLGCDVRWYASYIFEKKLKKLAIPHYRFTKALDVPSDKIDEVFPERKHIKGQVAKLNFDMIHYFILRSTEYMADIKDIHAEWKIDAVVADCVFSAIPFIKDEIHVPLISIGVMPLFESSKDLPPAGLGMEPVPGIAGRIKHEMLKKLANKVLFRKPNKIFFSLLKERNITCKADNAFDALVEKATIFLQSGTPGFEYKRSDLGKHIRYIGPLLPYSMKNGREKWYDDRLQEFKTVLLVTQGTVEKDTNKLLVPAIEAFKDTDKLLIVTTGGSGTQTLRNKYSHRNVIIEDFIAFIDVMPHADIFISNGGYGGVMQGIQYGLPMVVAGVHEGKNEINARINYYKYGINVGTETPTPAQLTNAVNKITGDPRYKNNINRLQKEFADYNPEELCAAYLQELLR